MTGDMATEIKLPNLGDGIESGEVLELFVKEGDTIEKDQSLLEIETDKATTNVPSEVSGKVLKVQVAEGDTVTIGQVLFQVEVSGGAAAPAAPAAKAPQAAPTQAAPSQAAPSQAASQSAPPKPSPAPATSAPATPAPTRPAPQPVASEAAEPAAAPAPVTSPATPAHKSAVAAGGSEAARVASAGTAPAGVSTADVPASPSIRRFAREVGIDLTSVQGSGPGGRISREDVLRVVKGGSRTSAAMVTSSMSPTNGAAGTATTGQATVGQKTPQGTADNDGFGPVTIEKMSRIRKTIAGKMHESWVTAPRVTNFDDADVTDLEEFRRSSKDDYAAQGIKLTSMPFVIKAVAMALRNHPSINASVDMEQGNIIYKNYVNVGIAVDTDRGLVVPSLRNADRSSIPDIARQLQAIATNARSNNFSIEDLRGSTFTISNLGAIGGTYSTPIINVPEAAILLLGRTRKLPVVVGDDIKARLMMPLSLSYDHRLIDGAMAARFLNDIIGYLKAPSRLLLAL